MKRSNDLATLLDARTRCALLPSLLWRSALLFLGDDNSITFNSTRSVNWMWGIWWWRAGGGERARRRRGQRGGFCTRPPQRGWFRRVRTGEKEEGEMWKRRILCARRGLRGRGGAVPAREGAERAAPRRARAASTRARRARSLCPRKRLLACNQVFAAGAARCRPPPAARPPPSPSPCLQRCAAPLHAAPRRAPSAARAARPHPACTPPCQCALLPFADQPWRGAARAANRAAPRRPRGAARKKCAGGRAVKRARRCSAATKTPPRRESVSGEAETKVAVRARARARARARVKHRGEAAGQRTREAGGGADAAGV
jgi:hypothetical protein